MTIGINNSSTPAGPAPDSVVGPAAGSVAGPATGAVTGPALGAVAGRVAPVVMEPNTPFYYGKAVTAEDFTSSKLYMKETIWIGGIPFTDTTDAWNYMLGIPDNKHRAEVAEDLGHQFVLLAEKMGDSYQTLSNLVKTTWKSTGMARDTMSDLLARL